MNSLTVKPQLTKRLTWLDSIRGLAIFFLILMHYIGALEARNVLPIEVVDCIKSIFRVATPLFITVFGFTLAHIFQNKLNDVSSLKKLSVWSVKRLPKVFFAREAIVIIYALSHPEQLTNLFKTLTYQQFAISGEILTFYFLAILLAPYILYFIVKKKISVSLPIFIILYLVTYYIGSNYHTLSEAFWFRLFFYDVYPFFPFFSCVIMGIYFAKLYQFLNNDSKRLKVFLTMSIIMIFLGVGFFSIISDNLLTDLSSAVYKAPPHPAYLLFYLGISLFFSCAMAVLIEFNYIPKWINKVLTIVGKNSLLSYVLHYLLHFTVPITVYLMGEKNTKIEIIVFICILFLIYQVLIWRTKHKQLN